MFYKTSFKTSRQVAYCLCITRLLLPCAPVASKSLEANLCTLPMAANLETLILVQAVIATLLSHIFMFSYASATFAPSGVAVTVTEGLVENEPNSHSG